jgi:hypothetical protein
VNRNTTEGTYPEGKVDRNKLNVDTKELVDRKTGTEDATGIYGSEFCIPKEEASKKYREGTYTEILHTVPINRK